MRITKAANIIAVIGLAVSIYLTLLRYTTAIPLVCPTSGVINCESVLTSQYSTLFGIPNAALGIVFFAAELLAIRWYFGKEQFLVLNGLGLAFVFYYIAGEYVLKSICIYCTTVHICVVVLLIIAVKY